LEIEIVKSHLLIIGGGLAGLSAAIEASKFDIDIILLSRSKVGYSGNTSICKGGFAAVIQGNEEGDMPYIHMVDTMKAGYYLNDEKLVKSMVERGEKTITTLDKYGVPFLKRENKYISLAAPGHSKKRYITIIDRLSKTHRLGGITITKNLMNKIKQKNNIKIYDNVFVVSLYCEGGRKYCIALDNKNKNIKLIYSNAIIIATGGCCGIYNNSTNTLDADGSGVYLAKHAGITINNMEFIQFHPLSAVDYPKTIIPTTIFSLGAILVNEKGEEFLNNYTDKNYMVERDIMSMAIFNEIKKTNNNIYLDFSRANIPELNALIPGFSMFEGINKVAIKPAAHFMMGGIKINEYTETNKEGIFAAGEVTSGIHGANRLAGNALLEAATFGEIAGFNAGKYSRSKTINSFIIDIEQLKDFIIFSEYSVSRNNNILAEVNKGFKFIMDKYIGLVRSRRELLNVNNKIASLIEVLKEYRPTEFGDFNRYFKVKIKLEVAMEVIKASLGRKESLGSFIIK
jgi:fumarate reductase (CoM/CoB) subunit A